MQTPREYIEDIKSRQVNSDKEFILDSLTGAIDRLQKAFPRYASFLMEFVQNADDAKSSTLKIELLGNEIKISNDGHAFSGEDVKSICKVGRSSKTPKDYIGYLGVGFKAVFLISEGPEIYSGGYQFRFDKANWDDAEHIPWQVIPVWIDTPKEGSSEHETIFVLPLKAPGLIAKLREEVKPEHLNSRILLFLRNIVQIDVMDTCENFSRKIVKSELAKTSDYEIYQIQEYENEELSNQSQWLIFRSVCTVPRDVQDDYITKEWERGDVEKREILVAFKLDNECNLVKEYKGTAHIGVFSFLPLKEVPSGLNFLLQADLLTAPGRGELARECLWNDWLANEIYKLIVEKCVPVFLSHEQWKMNFTDILYSSEGGHELFEEHVKIPLNKYLENNTVLIVEDGTPSKAEELILVNEEIRGLLLNEGLGITYPDKRVVHEKCKPHPSLKIKRAPEDINGFIRSPESERLMRLKASMKQIEWFKKLYRMLADKYNLRYFKNREFQYNVAHDNFWNSMCSFHKPIILTEGYNLATVGDCYVNPKKIAIPEKLKEKFKIVNPDLIKDEGFQEFKRKLNEIRYHYAEPSKKVIRELSDEEIKNVLRRQEALEMNKEKWEELSSHERVEKIKEIRELWSTHVISLEDYDYLTLESKNGEWVKPEQLVFPTEYKPEHSIERLIEKGILDFSLKFVSVRFIEGENDDEIRRWRRVFEKLGVDKVVQSGRKEGGRKEELVHRISVLTALQYERKSERSPKELGESEKPGYDIESKSESDERFIEVKGTSKTSWNIFLTVNEFKALREKRDKYFVYIVTDSLREPLLHTTRGSRLLEITDTQIIIPFNKWINEAKEEEFQP